MSQAYSPHLDNMMTFRTVIAAYYGCMKPTDYVFGKTVQASHVTDVFGSDNYSHSQKVAYALTYPDVSAGVKWVLDNGTNVELWVYFNAMVINTPVLIVDDNGATFSLEEYALVKYAEDPERFYSFDGVPWRSAIYAWLYNTTHSLVTLEQLMKSASNSAQFIWLYKFCLTMLDAEEAAKNNTYNEDHTPHGTFDYKKMLKKLHPRLYGYENMPASWVAEIFKFDKENIPNIVCNISADDTIRIISTPASTSR